MRTTRMVFGVAVVIALCVTLAACGGKSSSNSSTSSKAASTGSTGGQKDNLPNVITIGATSEKTGPVPVLGGESKGYLAAAKWVNSHGGIAGHKIKVIVHDNAGDPGKAVSDVRNYAQQGIKLVVGGAFGPDCAAEAPVTAQSDLIDFCGSTDDLPQPDTHMFGVGLGYTPTIKAAAQMIKGQGTTNVAVFADKDKSGDDSATEAPKQLKAAGVKVDLIRTQPTDASFKAAIQKAKADGVDGMWFTECTPAAISAVGDAKALGFKGKLYMENCLASFGVAQAMKALAGTDKSVLVQVPSMLLPGTASRTGEQEAVDTFKKAVPGPPDVVVGSGYDAIMIIKKLLEQTKTLDVKTNVAALENNFSFTGVWHGGTFTKSDHRGATADGYATPAAFTNKGTFVAVQ